MMDEASLKELLDGIAVGIRGRIYKDPRDCGGAQSDDQDQDQPLGQDQDPYSRGVLLGWDMVNEVLEDVFFAALADKCRKQWYTAEELAAPDMPRMPDTAIGGDSADLVMSLAPRAHRDAGRGRATSKRRRLQ